MRPDWRGTWQLGRAIVCCVAVFALAAVTLAATAGAASSASSAPSISEDKIRPKLSTQLENRAAVDFWIHFDANPDLTRASALENWDERGAAVAKALRQAARSSQQAVRQQLTGAGVDFQSFWATNAIKVRGGTQELAERLATRAEVGSLWPTFKVTPPKLERSPSGHSSNAVEWGLANINADDVWEQYEATGEGLVIANIDSGVQYDHPALVDHYRGNNGDGTFDHNYHWFDAANLCNGAPCDRDGHGTHTMGSMVGDGGAGNQIGVAPGATWIAANGCCPSDAALIASGQWMLEPTDLNGENPDASMRPNIINNSWGTELPSTAPFMEDISRAWTASGIFGVWSNGNNGSSCRTSGSPGSRIINYSVGSYDINNDIADSSSRGAGQDGETKPNISAPGVNVRSSVPGNGYASYDGTSMAAPHVAGAIALLWSAAPGLVGDLRTTKELLDDTATDHADDQCGGTADDNNVFGEGQLDALALLDAAPVGGAATLTGTISGAETGDPISGATVTVTGSVDRELTTGADGTYDTLMPAGDYTVAVSAYRYVEQTKPVTVAVGANTLDVALEPVESVTISGQVLDGSGHGWPLYAKVTVNGETTLSDYTDPETGTYEIKVPTGTTWTLEVESRYDGYETATAQIEAGSSDVVHDVSLPVDASRCIAEGYEYSAVQPVVSEDFDAGALPDGWTVEDHIGDGRVWRFDNPRNRSNRTGGDGAFAILDSEGYFLSSEDSSLVTPSMDLRDAESVVVQFSQDYEAHRNDELAVVGASVDGGATWQTMRDQTGDSRAGPRVTTVALPSAAGEAEVKVRWRYRGFFGYYWQVDDVVVGTRTCDPVNAGLVVGQVRDRNTDAALAGALVTNVDNPDQVATTMATPDDPALDGGFWWMVSELTGERPLSASAEEYQTQTNQVSVRADAVTPVDFRLAAGRLTVDKSELRSSLLLGGSASRTFTVTNDGTAPAQIELSGRDGSFEMLGGGADTTSSLRQLDSAAAAASRAHRSKPSASADSGKGSGFGPSGLEAGRSNVPTVPKAAADDVTITHSVSQELMVNSVSCTGGGTTSAAGFLRVFDLEEFDIATDFEVKSVSFGVEAARGTQPLSVKLYTLDGELAYDNLTPIGSAETTLQPQELTIVTVPVAGTAPAGSRLVVEIDSPDLGAIGAAFFPGSNNLGQTGPTYLRAADCGVPEPVPTDTIGRPDMHLVMNVTGEADSSMPWLSLDPETVRLAPGHSAQVRVTMDGHVDQPGTYAGRIRLAENTPYDTPSVEATMHITPPRTWGKVVGTVTGTSCHGDTAPIAEATVQVDWRSGYRTLYTDEVGEYAYWLDKRGNPYTFVAAKDGYRPLVRTVRVIKGRTRTVSFALQETRC